MTEPVWVRSRDACAALRVSGKTLVKWSDAGYLRSLILPGSRRRQHRLFDLSPYLSVTATEGENPSRQMEILLNLLTEDQLELYCAVCAAEGLATHLPSTDATP